MIWRDDLGNEPPMPSLAVGERILLGLIRLAAVPLILVAVLVTAMIHGGGFLLRRFARLVMFVAPARSRRAEQIYERR